MTGLTQGVPTGKVGEGPNLGGKSPKERGGWPR